MPNKLTVAFSRPVDEVEGPELGPYEWFQTTYTDLRCSPDGKVIAQFHDGYWYIEGDETEAKYSDLVIF